jgi:arabinogalactan endo-1,4-beta-galactosidase
MEKLQASTSKLQRNSNIQAPTTARHLLGAWSLMLLWSLVLGGWSFSSHAADFAFGADLSFLKQAEDRGKIFKDGTNALPGLQIFKNHGYNWIRLRIFVEPVGGNLPNDLKYTLTLAQDAKKLGYKFLLDFHYANTWADPGKQPTPGAWRDLTHKQRAEKVFEYTRDTIGAFRDAGVLPDMVQVGNEITAGMLWPDGKLPDNWDNFADYVRAGVKGICSGTGN